MMKRVLLLIALLLALAGCRHIEIGEYVPDGDDGDGGADGDTDGDVDGDTDGDVDGDTDGDIDGDIDGDTDGDVDGDTDVDVDSDTDTDTDGDGDIDGDGDTDIDPTCDPEYRYPADCMGDECDGDCCEDAICDSELLGSGDGYITYYCYPAPDDEAEPGMNPCECGDRLLDYWGFRVCVAQGTQETNTGDVQFKVLTEEYLDSLGGGLAQSDITMCNIPTTLDGSKIPLTICYGYAVTTDLDGSGGEDDEAVILAAQGQIGMTAVWMWQAIIPMEKWVTGVLDQSAWSGGADWDYSATLMYGTVVGTEVDQMWVEGMADDGQLEIVDTGELCGAGSCPKARIAIDLELAAIKAELGMDY